MGHLADPAPGAPVSDPAGIELFPQTLRIGDRRSATPAGAEAVSSCGRKSSRGKRRLLILKNLLIWRMKFSLRNPFCVFGLVLAWRVALLVFTAQPIPANDAFSYDGAVVNYLRTGHYCNPSLALVFPISGNEIYSQYPPLYQGALFGWMKLFGTSVISAMVLHFALFAVAGLLALGLVKKFFPAAGNYALAALLFFGFTFGDRPEDLAYVFGLGSLGLVTRQISGANPGVANAAGTALLLGFTLYTSVIVGAYFFGIGFLTCAAAWWWRRKIMLFVPFVLAALLFAVVTIFIAKTEPRWWAGFMESARQQSVLTTGFHAPVLLDLIKLARTAPVFLLALAALPFVVARRKEIFSEAAAWLWLVAGIFVMGGVLLALDMTLLPSNYVGYVMFSQIFLAAGMLALAAKFFPARENLLRLALAGCVVLVSIRAIGMTTWGAACAWKNSYWTTHETLRVELEPFTKSDAPAFVSSAFLYSGAEFGVKNLIYGDWYFDHAAWTNNADLIALIRLKPAKLVLTQFDYHRSYVPLLEKLRAQPGLVEVRVRDLASVRTPDSIPSLQRVVQHISWAPVIVDLEWK